MYNRVILVVLDGVGVGINPKVKERYISNSTFGDVVSKEGMPRTPTFEKLGFLNYAKESDLDKVEAMYGRMLEQSVYADSWAGHWELMGVKIDDSNEKYWKEGFSQEIIEKVEKCIGYKVLGNLAMSRREDVIYDLLPFHKENEKSVIVLTEEGIESIRTFGIYALESMVSNDVLYQLCEKVAEVLKPYNDKIGRVGARPLTLKNDMTVSVEHKKRKDFLIFDPPKYTLLDALTEKGIGTYGVGKIWAMFKGKGLKESKYALTNEDSYEKMMEFMREVEKGLIFVNFNDFDARYGHYFDTSGWITAFQKMDIYIKNLICAMELNDLLVICSDGHGCDCVYTGVHTKEYSPLILYSKQMTAHGNIGSGFKMADVATTIAENFGIYDKFEGTNILTSKIIDS